MKNFSLLNSRANGTMILVVLLCMTIILNFIAATVVPFTASTYLLFTPHWLHLVTLITAFLITPILVHLEPPLSSDSFTLTRPIDISKLFYAKAKLIWALGALAPAVGETLIVTKAGIPIDSLPLAFLFFLARNSAFVSIFFVIAVLTVKHLDFNVVSITTGLFMVLVWYARKTFGAYPLRAFYHDPPFEAARSLATTDARLALALYVSVSIFAGLAAFKAQAKTKSINIALILATGIILSLSIQSARVLIIRTAIPSTLNLPERKVTVRDPITYLTEIVSNNVDSKEIKTQLTFSIPLEEDSDSEFPYLLRFKEFSITDDLGREFPVPVANYGQLPCIDAKTIERYLLSKLGEKYSLLDAERCELGEEYVLPKEAKLSKDILPKLKGSAWGFNHELKIDYSALIKNGDVSETPRGSIRAVQYNETFGSFIRTGREVRKLVSEIEFFPSILNYPFADPGEGSPLYVHYYASARNYILLHTKSKTGKRFWADIRRPWSESNLSEFRITDPELLVDSTSWDTPLITDEDLSDSVFYRMSPAIKGSFLTEIEIENVPIVRRKLVSEEN